VVEIMLELRPTDLRRRKTSSPGWLLVWRFKPTVICFMSFVDSASERGGTLPAAWKPYIGVMSCAKSARA